MSEKESFSPADGEITVIEEEKGLALFGDPEAYSKVPPTAKNTNPRTTENTRPYNPNGRLNPV